MEAGIRRERREGYREGRRDAEVYGLLRIINEDGFKVNPHHHHHPPSPPLPLAAPVKLLTTRTTTAIATLTPLASHNAINFDWNHYRYFKLPFSECSHPTPTSNVINCHDH